MKIQNYCEEFIFPLNHHSHSTESGFQYISTCSETGRSEEDASTIFSLCSIEIAPIVCDIFKQVEVRKIKGNRHMISGVGDKRNPLYRQSNWLSRSGAGKPL